MTETKDKKNVELELVSNIKPGVLEFNYVALKGAMKARLAEYKSLVVTDDTLDGCKNAKSELVSFRNLLENFRKEKKGEAEKPIKEFDRQVKDLIGMVTDAEKPLDASLDVYAEKARLKKREFAARHIAEVAEAYGLRDSFAKRLLLKKEFMNASITQKAVKADIISQAESLKREQEEYDKNLSVIQETVDSENGRIQVKMDPDEYIFEFENGTDVLTVIKKIKKRADDIFKQEVRLEKERLEKERQEKERLEKERMESQRREVDDSLAQNMRQDSGPMTVPGSSFVPETGIAAGCFMGIHGDYTEDSCFDISHFDDDISCQPEAQAAAGIQAEESIDEAPSASLDDNEETGKESQYEVVFRVNGNFSALRSLNNYLKDNNIRYSVESQQKIKRGIY